MLCHLSSLQVVLGHFFSPVKFYILCFISATSIITGESFQFSGRTCPLGLSVPCMCRDNLTKIFITFIIIMNVHACKPTFNSIIFYTQNLHSMYLLWCLDLYLESWYLWLSSSRHYFAVFTSTTSMCRNDCAINGVSHIQLN